MRFIRAGRKQGRIGQTKSHSRRRVLLAEDNEMNQLIAGTFLSEYGFSVEVSSDGTEAVRLMEDKGI